MFIKTERLELRFICEEDLARLADLLADATVKKTYMLPDFRDRGEAMKLARRLMELSRQEGRYVAGIFLPEGLIGILNETEVSQGRIEVGYALLPPYYGHGYATEALRGAIGWFHGHGFREVLAGAFEENLPSIRVMEKSGMTRIPQTDEIDYRGKNHRCVYYLAAIQ